MGDAAARGIVPAWTGGKVSYYYAGDQATFDEGDLTGQVLTDTPCRQCSYNLRGLPKDGRCPECGTPIGVSIWGEMLRFSHPRWLRQVSDGAMMILWGLLVSFIVSIAAGIVMSHEPVIRQVFIALGSLVGVIGTWQMTSPDPSGIGEKPGLTARKLVRIAVTCGVAANVAQMLVRSGINPLFVAGFTALCSIVSVVGEYAKLHYIGLLAARLPDDALRDRANFLKWAMAVCYGGVALVAIAAVLAAASVAANVATGGRPSFTASPALGGLAAIGCIGGIAGIAMIVFAIMTLILIYRVAQAIKRQIPLSIELWNRNTQRAQAAKSRQAPSLGAAPAPVAAPTTSPPASTARDRPTPPPVPPAQNGNQRPYF